MRLSEYLNDTAVLLNDSGYSFNSRFQVTRWINEARRLLAMKTGCVQRLITGQSAWGAQSQAGSAIPTAVQPGAVPGAFNFGTASVGTASYAVAPPVGAALGPLMTIAGVERYPYEGFFNSYLQAQHAGCDKVNDVVSIAVNWGGVSKPTLDWLAWDDFQAYCRAYAVNNQSYPACWSVLNDGTAGEIWLFPIPSQPCEMEVYATVLPKPLYSDDDFDAIPDSFNDVVKFGATALAFMATNRYANAELMIQQGGGYVVTQRAAADRGKTRSYYFGLI